MFHAHCWGYDNWRGFANKLSFIGNTKSLRKESMIIYFLVNIWILPRRLRPRLAADFINVIFIFIAPPRYQIDDCAFSGADNVSFFGIIPRPIKLHDLHRFFQWLFPLSQRWQSTSVFRSLRILGGFSWLLPDLQVVWGVLIRDGFKPLLILIHHLLHSIRIILINYIDHRCV